LQGFIAPFGDPIRQTVVACRFTFARTSDPWYLIVANDILSLAGCAAQSKDSHHGKESERPLATQKALTRCIEPEHVASPFLPWTFAQIGGLALNLVATDCTTVVVFGRTGMADRGLMRIGDANLFSLSHGDD
jgi:hypothetical protein